MSSLYLFCFFVLVKGRNERKVWRIDSRLECLSSFRSLELRCGFNEASYHTITKVVVVFGSECESE